MPFDPPPAAPPALSDKDRHRLETHLELIRQWNDAVGLVSERDSGLLWERHVLDSLAVVPHISKQGRHLDAGSGGGFPAIPVAVLRPSLEVTLVERSQRKSAFLRHAAFELDLPNVSVVCRDLRQFSPIRRFDTATARGIAPPVAAWRMLRPLLAESGRLLVHHAGDIPAEIEGGALIATRSAGRGRLSEIERRAKS
ncbi:MAG: 16S rRNA (guanine(527)-N(7))-methyltransferase RsmG [Pseudomonadales bacterium]|nr:16S rRNA (guanine(527)-N(7))-methyltransferase RsmG [Pseudomonadales bacterium]